MTDIYVGNFTIIGSDNGLSPGRRQAIICTNAVMLLVGPLGTNFIEILIGIQAFLFKKMPLKMSSVKWRPFCLGLNVLNVHYIINKTPHLYNKRKSISQIPRCTSQMQQLVAEMCTRVHISVAKRRIVGYLAGVLWDLWDGFIPDKVVIPGRCKRP